MGCPDNYSQWEDHERQQEARMKKRPVCSYCEEHIQHDHFFLVNDEAICPDCMESYFRKEVGDFMG